MKQQPPGYKSRELLELSEIIRGRRTINLFLQMPVPSELVREAIEVATWAPNHHVTEPWKFYVFGAETISRCLNLIRDIVTEKKDADAAAFKAKSWSEKPGWLLVTCCRSGDDLRQQEDYAACSAAVQNLLLYLWKAGVGSKWTTGAITRDPRFFDILGIDAEQEMVVGLVWYGYPKLTPTQSRKIAEDVMTLLP
jgi:nitroreductase